MKTWIVYELLEGGRRETVAIIAGAPDERVAIGRATSELERRHPGEGPWLLSARALGPGELCWVVE